MTHHFSMYWLVIICVNYFVAVAVESCTAAIKGDTSKCHSTDTQQRSWSKGIENSKAEYSLSTCSDFQFALHFIFTNYTFTQFVHMHIPLIYVTHWTKTGCFHRSTLHKIYVLSHNFYTCFNRFAASQNKAQINKPFPIHKRTHLFMESNVSCPHSKDFKNYECLFMV